MPGPWPRRGLWGIPLPSELLSEVVRAHGLGVSAQAARPGPASASPLPGRAPPDRLLW